MVPQFALTVLISIAISIALNRLMLVLAPRLGLMDQPGERRIHSTPIPRAGGIAIWTTFQIVIAGALLTGKFTSGNFSWSWFGAFFAGSSILLISGFLDDRHGLSPWVKLSTHVLAPAVFFILHPLKTGIFPAEWPVACDFVVFMIWVVVLINAFNLIDGLDGLCGGLASLACVALAIMAFANGRMDSALLLLVMGGAILGFLRYNFNPARIFLGDAGSMIIGFFLATAATDAVGRKAVVGVILLPIAVAGVPLLDVLLAIWRRGSRRLIRQLHGEKIDGGIFAADKDHLHHRLLDSGGSQRRVAAILQGISILLALLAFLPMMFGDRVFGFSLVGFLIVGLVGMRNLARIEIEQTGSAIHMAIKLPGPRRRMAVLLFIYDLVVLSLSAGLAALIETNFLRRGASSGDLSRLIVTFAIFGSIALLVAQVHHRLWVRATMRDIMSLQFWLGVAAIATFSLFSLIFSNLEWSAMRMTLMAYVFSCAGVTVPRVALDLLREFGLDARHRRKKAPSSSAGNWPVAVIGAGDLGTLLLDHLKSSSHDLYPGMRLLGFLDEVPKLHGRRLRSFRVLGGLSMIPELVEEAGLKGVVLAVERPRRETLDQLEEYARMYDLKIFRWKVEVSEVPPLVGRTRATQPEAPAPAAPAAPASRPPRVTVGTH